MTRRNVSDLIKAFMDDVDARSSGSPPLLARVRTGHDELDQILCGLRPGLVHLLTGFPGVGTSTLALGFARQAAIHDQQPTLLITPACPAPEVMTRLLCAEAKVASHHARSVHMTDEDWQRLAENMERIADAPLVIDDTVYADITDLDPVVNSGYEGAPWQLVVLDGAGLLVRRTAPEHLWAAHTRLAADVKRLARRLDAPVVLTAPVGRQLAKRATSSRYAENARPQIGDVAISAAYEAEADVVIGIHRPDQFETDSYRAGEADLIVLKSRYSPTCTATVAFQGHYARFIDMQPG